MLEAEDSSQQVTRGSTNCCAGAVAEEEKALSWEDLEQCPHLVHFGCCHHQLDVEAAVVADPS